MCHALQQVTSSFGNFSVHVLTALNHSYPLRSPIIIKGSPYHASSRTWIDHLTLAKFD